MRLKTILASKPIQYTIIFSKKAKEQLKEIRDYIEEQFFSRQAADNTINNLLTGVGRLEDFPFVGFNADERVGKMIYPPHTTRCLVLHEYLVFYHVLDNSKQVFISHVMHVKLDYLKLFRKGK